MLRRLRRLAALPPRALADLLHAQAMLIHAQLLLWTRPAGRLLGAGTAEGTPLSAAQAARAEGLARAVERAARHGLIRPACLVRSLALCRLLEAHGIRGSRIHVGVRWQGRAFDAHAWVQHGARVLGDRPAHVNGFAELAGGRVPLA